MMRSMIRNGGVLVLVGMLVMVGKSLSEPKASPVPKSRIALINLAQLFKGYAKVARFNIEHVKLLEPLKIKEKRLQAQIDAHTKELETKEMSEEQRVELDTQLTEYKRKIEDIHNEAKRASIKKNETHMVIVYKELSELARRYAKEHDLDVVFHYNDVPTEDPAYFKPTNVSRKINSGTVVPLYIREGVDITNDMIAQLNDAYRAETKPDDKEEP
jgi:Skp family chaperone for outer membrane proteins